MRSEAGGREAAMLSAVLVPVVIMVAGLLGFLGVMEELMRGLNWYEEPGGVNWYLVAAAVVGVGGPVVGMVLAGRRPVRVVHGVLLALTVVLLVIAVAESGVNSPAREKPHPAPDCVEYSGGDSDCPGG